MKKATKIVLLVILAVVAGVVLYDLVFCWPVHPSLQKPAESYEQLSQTAKKLGVLAPPEDILPWKQEEYSIYLSSTGRFARPTGWDMAGKVIYDGTTYPGVHPGAAKYGEARGISAAERELQACAHLPGMQ